ncbi:MAG: DMT family transporter [Thermodesulfovibrionales bacterium]|nr:DMT family transporter [Thermodesulfovibrionales bacterium]
MGYLYIVSAILLWSSLGVVVRLSGVPVHVLIFYSNGISVLILSVLLAKKKYRLEFLKGNTGYLLFLGPLTLLNTSSFFYAFKNTTIANAIFTHYIAPVVVAFLAPLFLRERLTLRVLFSIAVASAGLWILLGMNLGELLTCWKEPDRDTVGILSGLFSGVTYAFLIIAVRVYAQRYNPLVLCLAQNIVISLILMPFVRVFPVDALWSFIIVGVVHSTIAPVLYFRGMSEVSATRTAILGYIEPVGAIIFAVIFLKEYPEGGAVLGGALIILSGYMTLKEKKHS